MSAPPYMPLYVGDYLADTTHLTQAETGAYLLLLMAMWRGGGRLPADDKSLARMSRSTAPQWRRIRAQIMPFFTVEAGFVSQRRLAVELTKYEATLSQKREAGARGGKAKALKDKGADLAAAIATPCQPEPEPERKSSDPNGSASEPPDERLSKREEKLDPNTEAWRRGVELLVVKGRLRDAKARTFFGGLLKSTGLEARDLLPAIVRAELTGSEDPQGYLRRAAQAVASRISTEREPSKEDRVAAWEPDTWRVAVRRFTESGRWGDAMGPPPGEPGCRVPLEVLREANYAPRLSVVSA